MEEKISTLTRRTFFARFLFFMWGGEDPTGLSQGKINMTFIDTQTNSHLTRYPSFVGEQYGTPLVTYEGGA